MYVHLITTELLYMYRKHWLYYSYFLIVCQLFCLKGHYCNSILCNKYLLKCTIKQQLILLFYTRYDQQSGIIHDYTLIFSKFVEVHIWPINVLTEINIFWNTKFIPFKMYHWTLIYEQSTKYISTMFKSYNKSINH